MKIERYKFLEFFDAERYIQEGAQIVEYNVITSIDFMFEITLFIYDDCATIALYYLKNNHKLFGFGIDNIDAIDVDNKNIKFYRKNLFDPFLVIQIKPEFYISHDSIICANES